MTEKMKTEMLEMNLMLLFVRDALEKPSQGGRTMVLRATVAMVATRASTARMRT